MKNKTEVLGKPALTTTDICKKLGINVSVDFIETKLGVIADEKTSTSSLWLDSKFDLICLGLGKYFFKLCTKRGDVGCAPTWNFGTPTKGQCPNLLFRECANTIFEHSKKSENSLNDSLTCVFFGGFKMGVETQKERNS